MKNNPYLGPRPYERGDRHNFFGRDRDARDLVALILAEREVLFYAQSGAGKTSLLNAQVIPALEEEGFLVLPVTRVGSSLPPDLSDQAVNNIFVLSALMGLAGKDMSAEALLNHTLLSFLREAYLKPGDHVKRRPPLLILDQFEELFTTHQDRWKDANEFFVQVREALDAEPNLGIVFAMREDHVAELDPYARFLPHRMAARYRMERLRREEALEAVARPAMNAGCPFGSGVAERLVDDLSRIRVQQRGEAIQGEAEIVGPVVEPVQLQVVCQRLWENLPEQSDRVIQWQEVSQFGNIDRALTDFYESALMQTCQVSQDLTGLKIVERQLRRWFSDKLITPMGTRGLALRGKEDTAGLPNAVASLLEDRHLIRADVRAGSTWYELSHDRLVEPILQSNRTWEAARHTPLRVAAQNWQEAKSEGLLYRDKALKEASAWAKANPDDVEPYEREFIEASQVAEQSRARRRRLYVAGAIAATIIVAVMAVLAFVAFTERRQARALSQFATARQLAAQAQTVLDDALADASSETVQVRQATPTVSPSSSGLVRSILLAIESVRRQPTLEGDQALRRGLDLLRGPTTPMKHDRSVWAVALSPDGKWVASASSDATARVWQVSTGREALRLAHGQDVYAVTFSPDGQWVATASGDATARVWALSAGKEIARMNHMGEVNTVAFRPDGQWIASGSTDNTVRVWEASTGKEIARMTHEGAVWAVAFSPDGRWVASASGDKTARVWEASTGREIARMIHDKQVLVVAFSPDGRWVASGSEDKTVRAWEADTGKLLRQMTHDGTVTTLAFSLDGQRVASGSDDKTVRVWEVSTGRIMSQMIHEETVRKSGAVRQEGVRAVTFSRDGQWIASGSGDRTVRVWEAATGREVARIRLRSGANAVAFSPDGRQIASGSDDSVGIWSWKPEDLIAAACARLPRNLTREEWRRYISDQPYRKTCDELPLELEETPTPTPRPTGTGIQALAGEHILDVPYKSQNDPDAQAENNDSGPTCLAMILAAQGQNVSTAEVYAASGVTTDRPLSFSELQVAAARFDLALSWKINASLNEIRNSIDAGIPVIALVKYKYLPDRQGQSTTGGHYVLVVGYDDNAGEIVIHDPYYWGPLRTKGAFHRYDYSTWEQAWGRSHEDGNPDHALLVPRIARPIGMLPTPGGTVSTPTPMSATSLPVTVSPTRPPGALPTPTWPYGKALTGVALANLQLLTPQELEAIRVSQVEAVRVVSLPDPDENKQLIRELRAVRPDLFIVARLFFPTDYSSRTRFSPQLFADGVGAGYDALYQAGVRYFEIHYEPNHIVLGMGWNWKDGAEFGAWFLQVRDLLKARHKDAQLGFPGLSPQPNVPDFLNGAASAVDQADWIGAHCYWQTADRPPWAMTSDNGGMCWRGFRDRFPDKLLIITEFSNNNPSVPPAEKAQQYARYFQLLRREPNVAAAFSFALNWPGQDVNRESWVADDVVTDIPKTLGSLIGQPGFLDSPKP